MSDLKYSTIKVPTIKGEIKGEYHFVNDRLQKYSVELPANMVGEFSLDFSPQDVVTVNGKIVNLSFGTIRLEPGQNNIEVRINSF